MNRNRHRVVFNAARGQLMVVGENAGSGASGETSAPGSTRAPLAPLALSVALALALGAAHAQIVADPSAPGNQRPTILPAGNGATVVNIQTPSAAGVSRNVYRQFDVPPSGAILNNSRTNVQTQIGGWISGNPWIGTPARVILNEVNSSNPSYLNGPLEVAGQRAEVIVANPSGIRVNGGTFLNTSGVTLTTGIPVMNSGSLESFLVRGGTVHIEGLGLDTRTADTTTILARAVEVNAGLWAEQLKVVTGANEVSADANGITAAPAIAQGPAPQFALDVAAIGGMYAGKIFLVGTEAGLGINNAGTLSASAGHFELQADGWLRNTGSVQSSGNLTVKAQGDVANTGASAQMYAAGSQHIDAGGALTNSGLIAARGDLGLQADSVNSSGSLAAGLNTDGSLKPEAALLDVKATQQLTAQGTNLSSGHLQLQGQALDMSHSETRARTVSLNAAERIDASAAHLFALSQVDIAGQTVITANTELQTPGDMHITAGTLLNQGGALVAGGDLGIVVADLIDNSGELLAARHLALNAHSLNNMATGEISAGTTTNIQVEEALTNRGLIDGKSTLLRADALANIGTGRLYGDTLAIEADTLINDTETVGGVRTDAVIAARSRLDIGARELINREGAAIFSAGDMAIGGALDANARADGASSGMAEKIQNQSATIEALGALAIATQTLENTNPHFTYTVSPAVEGGTSKVDYYASSGYISGNDVGWSVVEYDGPYEYRDPTKSGTKILLKTSAYADPKFRAFYLGPTPFIEGHTEWWSSGDTGGSEWIPDTYGYDRDSTIWAAFGMTAPAWGNPGQKPRAVPGPGDSGQMIPPDPAAVAEWEARIAPWVELTARYNAFKGTVSGQLIPINLFRSYNETEQRAEVTSSQPARIVSGADLQLKIGQSALNENSHIVAGGSLNVTGASVINQAAQVNAPTLRSGTLSTWTIVGTHCNEFGCEPEYDWSHAAYAESISHTVPLPSIRYEANAASGQAPLTIGALPAAPNGTTPAAGLAVPSGGLFKTRPDSTATYLVETDPRFANHRQWLSSDYLLQALSMDPATTQKRLGDGFYEQQLVREQIAALTGRRFLGDYTSDDEQYKALMTHGATFAQTFDLRPGIALTAEQVARLTSDIVWLVTETVTLPDGSTQHVLVPRVYAIPREGDLVETGALLAGQSVKLNLSGDLTNAGTLNGRQITQITAENVHNLDGLIGGGQRTQVVARQDIHNLGGSLSASEELRLGAGRNITVQSTASQGHGDTGQGVYSSQGIDRVAGLYVSKDAGVLIASAGGDVNLTAAQVWSAGSAQMQAVGDITLGSAKTATRMDATRDARNHTRIEHTGEVGTQIQAGGAVSLNAGRDVNARAATVQADGALGLQAGRDVTLSSGERSLSTDVAAYVEGRSGLVSGSTERRDSRSDTAAISSSLGGEQVNIRSGQDVKVQGSSVIGDAGVGIQAGGDVHIVAAQTTHNESHFLEQKGNGLSFEGAGITYGSQRESSDQDMQDTRSVASTVGAISGDVNITAGKTYTQTGSDVLSPGGDISIAAQGVSITEARETSRTEIEQKFDKSGVTLAVGGPAVALMQNMSSQMEAAENTKDARMQGLAAANSAMAVNNARKNAQANTGSQGDAAGGESPMADGVTLTLSIGASSSHSQSLQTGDSARGSSVAAGGNVNITARGAGNESDILIRGSDISAGKNANLNAQGDIELQAAQNTASLTGSNQSSSGSVGVSYGIGGFSVSASASSARGNEAGDDLVHTHTHITAGNKVGIGSGGDTTLQGALVKADTIQADVGGHLKIESLQDTSTYTSKQSSVGAGGSFGASTSGSFSASKSHVKSDYASVAEQSGLKAGDGGFQVNVGGDTTLIGGAIASNQRAVDEGKNHFSTGGALSTTDIQNRARYSASTTSVSAGGGDDGKNKGSSGVGVGVGHDSGSASSVTTAGISGIAGNKSIRSTDAETGIARIFDKEAVQKEVDAQAVITEYFLREAPKAVASYAQSKMVELKADFDASEGDPARQAEIKAEIDKWDEGGVYRIGMHTVVGGLSGGFGGAAGAAVSGASANAMNAWQDGMEQGLVALGFEDGTAKAMAQGVATITAAGVGAVVGGTYGAASAATVDANNRQLHPTEAKLIKENARRFAKKLYGTDQPSGEQIEAAQAMLTNTAQNAVDNNWGFDVPYFEEADAFLQQLKVEYQQQHGTLTLPGTGGQRGGAQQLFYADAQQKNQAWINLGLADPAITGLIVRTPIKPQTNPDALDPSRDRLTGLPLDDKGRYTVRVDLGNPFDGYETYTPKYFPCATAECVRLGQNLDMSDPETQAYVKALDAQIFKDIGIAATASMLIVPTGAAAAAVGGVGLLASAGQVFTGSPLTDQTLSELSQRGGQWFFENVLRFPTAAAARAVAMIDLNGGWDSFINRAKIDLFNSKVEK